jgi:hypothetical protein
MINGNPTTVMDVLTLFAMLTFWNNLMILKKNYTQWLAEDMNKLLIEIKKIHWRIQRANSRVEFRAN